MRSLVGLGPTSMTMRHVDVETVETWLGSWLNQVEIWFGILTANALRGASFTSTTALEDTHLRLHRLW